MTGHNAGADDSWFRQMGLGLFIHWGHASTKGWELSWQMTGGHANMQPQLDPVDCETYFANAKTFNPTRFDAEDWAEEAWSAGARYVVFTTKHHDGFAMFDTRLSEYSVARTAPFGRDITREVIDAFRARGFRIGVYFSIVDWHHEDYPRMTDDSVRKPYVTGFYGRGTDKQWESYRQFMLGQLDELLTGYGALDIVWLDGEFEHTAEEWRYDEIRDLIRQRQPGALVNDRCVGFGDFLTPEQQLPMSPPVGAWESCITMNSNWGYVPSDKTWKSTTTLIHTLVDAASMGGNLLINVGPMGNGEFPPEAHDRLRGLASWMRRHSESIYGTRPGLSLSQFASPSTQRDIEGGCRIYLHLTMRPYDRVVVRGMPVERIVAVSLLGHNRSLPWTAGTWLSEAQKGVSDPRGDLVVELTDDDLDEFCTVVVVDVSSQAPPTRPRSVTE